jgi:hypothetical protein
MQFRQNAQRDDRRRRVLNDETLGDAVRPQPEEAEAPSTRRSSRGPRKPARRYSEAALMDGQPRLTDLIPKRPLTFVLIFLGGLLLIAGLETAYYYMPILGVHATDGRVEAIDLDGEGTLAVWFSSALLSLAGLTALVTFAVRRQRMDDYHGRYRIWLWGAMCWFLMSLDETASLHEGFKEMMSHLTGRRLMGDGSLWWVMPYMLLLGVVGFRLLLDMRDSRWATALFLLTAVSLALAVVTQLGWILPESGARGVMLEEGCEMLGFLLLLLCMGVYARHVILDAQGLLPQRAARPKKARKESRSKDVDAESAKKSDVVDAKPSRSSDAAKAAPSKPVTSEPAKKPALASGSQQVTLGSTKLRVDQPDDDEPRQRMSKADRKAIRRQQQEERGERYR